MTRRELCLVPLSIPLSVPLAARLAPGAELILHNGKIVTADGKFSIHQAVAVTDGKIVAVGDDRTALAYRGPRTRVIDLKGKTVLPGLIDSHLHALWSGVSEFRGPLAPLDSYAAIQKFIRDQAAVTPAGKWIIVPRTFPTRVKEMRMPTRDTLDVAPGHPVYFDASYTVVVNSLGLKVCGIARNTPNPPGGEIVKDEKGEPNGILRHCEPLLKSVEQARPFTESENLQALEKMLRMYAAAGLTSIGDRACDPEQIGLYQKLKAGGRLPIRAVLTWRANAALPTDEVIRQIKAAPYTTNTGDEWLKFGAFKVTLDGGMTIGSAYQRHPYGAFGKQLYGITNPEDRGQLFVPARKLYEIFRAARDKGWQLTAHSQGGGAVDAMLDAFEALNRERPLAPTRSHLIHASFQSPEAIERARKLGILMDVQAAWLYLDAPALEKVFTHQGMRYFYPLRSYLNAGVKIAGGSDHMIRWDKNHAINPYNPFLSMWTAVTRKTDRGEVLYPEECITREEALKMHTTWAAYLQFSEKAKGSIETGKLADMVVIDRDYLTCPVEEIKDIEPLATIIGGKMAYSTTAVG
jgi:predicted amidohydrolase YtcJ